MQSVKIQSILSYMYMSCFAGCGNLTVPEFGELSLLSGTNVGSEALYNCTEGFELIESRTRVCQQNGEWSGDEPICLGLLL